MGHHSHLVIAGHQFMHCRDGYLPDLAALFTESDRQPVVRHTHDNGQPWAEFVYATTVGALRERLQVQGFTAARAQADLTRALTAWGQQPENTPGWSGPSLGKQEIEAEARLRLATAWEDTAPEKLILPDPLDALSWHMDARSLARLLTEWAPDPQANACLDLTQLTGCCVELDPTRPVASQARTAQLAGLSLDAPLLVLTEGTTDARLLAAGMEVTHPHLVGYVNFFDFAVSAAEGGVAQLAKTVSAFIAAGIANRFVALADNDTASHAGLVKLKSQPLSERCRVLHYPSLPLLERYPTLGPYTEEPVPADVNGRAGALEMYLGRDVLQGEDGLLMPVQWKAWIFQLGRYQGALTERDKPVAQKRFMAKVEAHRAGQADGQADWSGIRAIIDTIVTAFD